MIADLSVVAALGGLAGVAAALTLLALACTALAVAALWRMRTDYRLIEAAERLQPVDLTYLVKKYVPPELQSQKISEELPIAKAAIGARWPRWTRLATITGAVMLAAASGTAFLVHRNLQAKAQVAAVDAPVAPVVAPAPRPVVKQTPKLDVLQTIQGTWGLKFDFTQSCAENPQTIVVSTDRKQVSVHYTKPIWTGTKSVSDLTFDVVSTLPDTLVLAVNDVDLPNGREPPRLTIKFEDANTYEIRRDDAPLSATGAIIRCPST